MQTGLTPQTIGIMFTSIFMATAGQLLLRAGMESVGLVELTGDSLTTAARSAITTWQILVGLSAFGLSAVLWLISLSRVPLSTAYPFVSLSYVLILLASVVILGERPLALNWLGAGLIMTGITVIGFANR
jgi:drug/metabolite transporter (DMT)-like permease